MTQPAGVGRGGDGERRRERTARLIQRTGMVLLAVGAVVTVVGTLRPWVASGSKRRHSYDIVELVEGLGFAPDGAVEMALHAWPLVPLLLVGAVAAAWWRWLWLAAVVGTIAAVYAGGVGFAVWRAPEVSVVRPLNGGLVTAGGAIVVLLGSIGCAVGAFSARRR